MSSQDQGFQILITNTINAISQSRDITSPNSGTSIIQVIGTWVGTLVVEGSNDGVTYYPCIIMDSSGLVVANITANGQYTSNTNGFQFLIIRSSAWTSGTATIHVYGSDSPSLNTDINLLRGATNGTLIGNNTNRLLVDGSTVTQPVSAASLPLPTGASTSALQTTGNASLASIDAGIPNALGAATTANSMPVNIASDQIVPISAASLPLPTGAATAANQATEIASLSSIDGKLTTTNSSLSSIDAGIPAALGQTTMASSMPVTIASNQTALPINDNGGSLTVDGTVELGATTLSALESITVQNGAGASAVNIQDGGNSITVDGTVAISGSVAVTGPLTDAQLRATPVPVSLTSTTVTNTVAISAVSLPLPTGAATAANQATEIASLSSIDSKLTTTNSSLASIDAGIPVALGQTTMAASMPVVIASNQSAIPVSFTPATTTDLLATDTITALNDSVTANTQGRGTVAFTVTGTWVATLTIQGTVDGINWVTVDGVLRPTNTLVTTLTTNNTVLVECAGFQSVRLTATAFTSGTATVAYDASVQINNDDATYGNNGQAIPAQSQLVSGSDGTNMRPLAVDSSGRLVTTALTGFGADFAFGNITTAALTRVLVNKTTYTAPTTNAQRSISSANANDTAAGTGARTVLLTYFDVTGAGPFTETITLNGTTAVNTVATNICFIEELKVITAGSTGSNVGIITLFGATAGGGGTVGTIAATDNQTFWTHHYVAIGKTCSITGVSCGHNGTTVGSGALFTLNSRTIGVANAAEIQISDFVRLYGQTSTFSRVYQSPIKVIGPALVRVFCTPETASSTIYRSAFDFFET
jgi:hypothetical protein